MRIGRCGADGRDRRWGLRPGDATKMTGSVSSPASTPRFDSLLIVRLSAMGDIIHTLPAAAALRQAFPHATLGWLVEERWAELLCTLRYPRSGQRSSPVSYTHLTLPTKRIV